MANKRRILKKRKKYKKEHRKEINKRRVEKLKKDPIFKLQVYLRARLYTAIKRSYKAGSAIDDLGCSI